MKNAKKTIVVVALIALMAIPSMFAYFTDTETKDATFTTGDIEVTLTDGIVDAENVVPNQPIETSTTVANTSTTGNDAYVFVKVTADDKYFNAVVDNDNWTAVTGEEDLYAYAPSGNLKKLAVGDTAVNVFDSIRVQEDLVSPTDELQEDLKITVEAYAIQSEYLLDDNTAPASVEKAWEAYENPTTGIN